MIGWLSGYTQRKLMTVRTGYLTAALPGYPSPLPITADTQIGAVCRADGFDLRFTALDGTTLLTHQRVSFSVAGGAATAFYWLKVDHTVSPATQVYCYFGKTDAVDVSDEAGTFSAYTRRWSLREAYSTAAGNYKDSLGVGHLTLTDADADSGRGVGPVDFAVDLAGDADFLTDADHADHDPVGAMTIEAWVNFDALPAPGTSLAMHDLSSIKWGLFYTGNAGGSLQFFARTSSLFNAAETIILSTGALYYVVGTYDKTLASKRYKLYRGGVEVASALGANGDIVAGDEGVIIGKYATSFLNGFEAEIRYSKTDAKSAAWIWFTQNAIRSVDGEWNWGALEVAPFRVFYGKKIGGVR